MSTAFSGISQIYSLVESIQRDTLTSFDGLDGGLDFTNCPTCNGIGRVKK